MNGISLRVTAAMLFAVLLLQCSPAAEPALNSGTRGAARASAGSSGTAGSPQTSLGGAGSGSGGSSGSSAGTGGSGGASAGSGGSATAGTAGSAGNGGRAGSAGGAPPYAPCPAMGKCVIMPLGDSITEGYNSSTGGGYRLRLLHDIWTASHDATFVGNSSSGPDKLDGQPFPKNNEGHSGYTIDTAPAVMRSGITPLVEASLQKNTPHVVMLMIGTNDVGTNNDLVNAPVRLAKLVDIITNTSPNALLVLAKITPPGDNMGNLRAEAYNAAIPDLVQTRVAAGKHIIIVDMYAPFAAHPEYMDGLHPKDVGYDFMGDIWYAGLAPHL